MLNKLPASIRILGESIDAILPPTQIRVTSCIATTIVHGMYIKLTCNFRGLGVVAQRVGIRPVTHEGGVSILPGRASIFFLVSGHSRWRDATDPTSQLRESLVPFWAIHNDLLGIVSLQYVATVT